MQKKVKKIIPYCLILIILFGLFSPMVKVSAQTPPATTIPAQTTPTATATPPVVTPAPDSTNKNALYNSLTSCPPVDGCIAIIVYWFFYAIPSFLLGVVANFFDVIIALTIHSDLYNKSTFIGNAWTVVRDLSNIFFILILIYVAIQTILGLGHETKKIIVKVIIMALLINFSMFFTKVVIDSSNILALVFYNKINVTVVRDGKIIDTNYVSVLAGGKDKDVAGKLMAYFDPTKILSEEFFNKFREKTYTFSLKGAALATGAGAVGGSLIPIVGTGIGATAGLVGYALSGFGNSIPLSVSVGFILIAGSIILFASYAFFVAGLSFLARMIELWILIIFSPFAFMSSSIPKLAGMEYIGWESWIKRLVKLSFMAPIFMFFMYLIFMIIQSNIFSGLVDRSDPTKQGWMETIILMVIPALIILILLLKATKFAKDASDKLGEVVIGGAKLVAGLAVGGAALGVASVGRGSVGAFMKGASTGNTAAQRFERGETLGRFDKFIGEKLKGTWIDRQQRSLGDKINADQTHVEAASHARHELDAEAGARFDGRKFNDLTQPERDTIRIRISRDNEGVKQFGKKYKDLDATNKAVVDNKIGADTKGNILSGGQLANKASHADHLIKESKEKQGLGSSLLQSARTGSYDVRNIANIIAKEQSTGFAKFASGLTGALAMSMRGGFKSLGVNYGESQGEFFKDLGNTISEALKSANIKVDLSHVGEVKKEDSHGKKAGGGGGGGHH